VDSSPRELERISTVIRRTGLSRSSVYALAARGDFPKQINLTPACVAWDRSEVDAWIAARIAERDAKAAA
jgi:prophage regulatory protein